MNTVKKLSKRLTRWRGEFQGFDLDIRYRKGSEIIIPEALSRRPDFPNAIVQYNEYIQHIEKYLLDKTLPRDLVMRAKVQLPPNKVASPLENFHLDAHHLALSKPWPLAKSHLRSPTPVQKRFYWTQKSCAFLHLLTWALNRQESPKKQAEV